MGDPPCIGYIYHDSMHALKSNQVMVLLSLPEASVLSGASAN